MEARPSGPVALSSRFLDNTLVLLCYKLLGCKDLPRASPNRVRMTAAGMRNHCPAAPRVGAVAGERYAQDRFSSLETERRTSRQPPVWRSDRRKRPQPPIATIPIHRASGFPHALMVPNPKGRLPRSRSTERTLRKSAQQEARDHDPQSGDRVGIMPLGADAASRVGGTPSAIGARIIQHGRRELRGKNGSAR